MFSFTSLQSVLLTGDCLGIATFVYDFDDGLSTRSGVNFFILKLNGRT